MQALRRRRGSRIGGALAIATALVFALSGISTIATAEPTVVAKALFKGKALLQIDGRAELMRDGEISKEGVHLLEATSELARIEIAGITREVRLDQRIGGNLPSAPARPIVRLLPGEHGHYFADGQINGHLVRFLVDTGASTVAINKPTARSLGLQYTVVGQPGHVETASGIAKAYEVMFNEVKVHAITMRNVVGMVVDGDQPRYPLLGQSFLNRLDIHRSGTVMELRAR